METHKSRVVNLMDNQLLDSIRQIIREETADIKEDVSILKKDVSELKTDVSVLKEDVSGLKTDVNSLKNQVSENTAILRALEENKEYQNAKMDKIENDIAELKGRDKRLLNLEDEFISHTHKIVIETGKAEIKAG